MRSPRRFQGSLTGSCGRTDLLSDSFCWASSLNRHLTCPRSTASWRRHWGPLPGPAPSSCLPSPSPPQSPHCALRALQARRNCSLPFLGDMQLLVFQTRAAFLPVTCRVLGNRAVAVYSQEETQTSAHRLGPRAGQVGENKAPCRMHPSSGNQGSGGGAGCLFLGLKGQSPR